jgi:hypothetical protein
VIATEFLCVFSRFSSDYAKTTALSNVKHSILRSDDARLSSARHGLLLEAAAAVCKDSAGVYVFIYAVYKLLVYRVSRVSVSWLALEFRSWFRIRSPAAVG